MSQYQDYFFSEDEQQDQYSMLNSPCINDKKMKDIEFFVDRDFYKEVPPTEEVPETSEIYLKFLSHQEKYQLINSQIEDNKQINFDRSAYSQQNSHTRQQIHVVGSLRLKRIIQVDNKKTSKRKQIFKGLKDDTTELNINLKTILFNKFKEFSLSKQLGTEQIKIVQQFNKRIASFASIKKLVKSQIIKQKGLKFIQSSKLAIQVIKSLSQFENKLTLCKYLECVKLNFESQNITKWKQINFYQNQIKQKTTDS